MPDKEKVIETFDEAKELVWTDDDEYTVGYNNGLEAGKNIALALLKEQEAVKPTWNRGRPFCGACGLRIRGGKFCSQCGKPILWEGRWWNGSAWV